MTLPSGGSPDDLIFQALVNDRTIEFFDRFDANISKLDASSRQGFNQVDQSVQGLGTSVGIISGIVGGLTTKILEFGYKGLQGFINYAQGAAALSARVETLGVVLQKMGARAGYSTDEIAKEEEEVKALGITTQATRQSLARMIRANIDLAYASDLARIAQNSAVVAGIDSSQAFERLVRGIQKREPELLDELGIQLRRGDAYERLASEIGKTSKELTNQEQQQAILNEIFRQSEAVVGVYDAAMGTVGKQMTSTARLSEELQLAVGDIFRPSLGLLVTAYQENLKEAHRWTQENKDELEEMGIILTNTVEAGIEGFNSLKDVLAGIPGFIVDISEGTANLLDVLLGLGIGEEQIEKNIDNLGTSFRELLSLIIGGTVAIGQLSSQVVGGIIQLYQGMFAEISGNAEEATRLIEEARDSLGIIFDRGAQQQLFGEAIVDVGEILNLIPKATDELENLGEEFDEAGDAADDFSNVLNELDQEFRDLFESMQEDLFEEALKDARRAQEDALRLSYRLEDLERSHQERIRSIISDANDQERDEVEGHSQRLIDIEVNYQRRLQDIRSNFEFQADELARRRDAIGLLRLRRQNQRELDVAARNKGRERSDESVRYQRRIAEIRQNLQEELIAAEEARQKDYENLQRSLEREEKIRELHRRFAEEDRRRALDKELRELANHYTGIEGLTLSHMTNIVNMWSQHLGNLGAFTSQFYQQLSNSFPYPSSNNPQYVPFRSSSFSGAGNVIGQGGQVSNLLANPFIIPKDFGRSSVPQIPAVSPGSGGSNHRTIEVKLDAKGLAPVLQRQLVNMLVEVERNR